MTSSINRRVLVSHHNTWVQGTIIDGFMDKPEQGYLYDIKLDQPDHNGISVVTGRPHRIGLRQANFRFIDNQAA